MVFVAARASLKYDGNILIDVRFFEPGAVAVTDIGIAPVRWLSGERCIEAGRGIKVGRVRCVSVEHPSAERNESDRVEYRFFVHS